MLKYLSLFALFAVFNSINGRALELDYGLKGGVSVTQHKVLNSLGGRYGSQSMGLGYVAGLYWDTPGEGFGFEVDLLFTQRSSTPLSLYGTPLIYTFKNLEIPLIGYYRWSNVNFGLGAYLKHGIGKIKINGGVVSPEKEYSYGELGVLQYELGGLASLGSRFDTGIGVVNIETRVWLGLSNRAKTKTGKTELSSLGYDMLLGFAF